MPFANNQRITRRRSSAGPTPPKRPIGNNSESIGRQAQGPRPTFLTLRDHGKVFVADLPNLSDGQLAHISKEANEVLNSLEKSCLLYTSPSPRDRSLSRMPSSA